MPKREGKWAVLYCDFFRHPKLAGLTNDAVLTFIHSVLHSVEMGTDGIVTNWRQNALPFGEKSQNSKRQLLQAGLWEQLPDGRIRIHDFEQAQRRSDQVERSREQGRERTARWRERQLDDKSSSDKYYSLRRHSDASQIRIRGTTVFNPSSKQVNASREARGDDDNLKSTFLEVVDRIARARVDAKLAHDPDSVRSVRGYIRSVSEDVTKAMGRDICSLISMGLGVDEVICSLEPSADRGPCEYCRRPDHSVTRCPYSAAHRGD